MLLTLKVPYLEPLGVCQFLQSLIQQRTNPEHALFSARRLVNVDMGSFANGDLACSFIDRHRLERVPIVNVNRLENILRTAQDDQSFAADVRLCHRLCQDMQSSW